ncbi:MAG: hypothetical protein EOR04_07135 [Mesorhizobium sp.]|uniref:hypothetical protein n=1 Tax=Mesorhizobium sp. TaxID=1871066 RepID=UPI000FE715B3|nr:hypothetical protein [Mesorhizobium sp.]RWP43976.1 MAG: hypothetical protein EOR04_07135 [Mesorhizobium sp.]
MPAEAAVLQSRTDGNRLAEIDAAVLASVAAWRAEICCVPRLTTIPRKDGWLLSVVFMHIYANSGLAMRAHLASKKL